MNGVEINTRAYVATRLLLRWDYLYAVTLKTKVFGDYNHARLEVSWITSTRGLLLRGYTGSSRGIARTWPGRSFIAILLTKSRGAVGLAWVLALAFEKFPFSKLSLYTCTRSTAFVPAASYSAGTELRANLWTTQIGASFAEIEAHADSKPLCREATRNALISS